MIANIKNYIGLLVMCCMPMLVTGQIATDCDPFANQPITQGEVLINYGSVTNSYSFKNRSSYTIAQPLIGIGVGKEYSSEMGFWTRFLLPPFAPQVAGSQGDFPDRVLIKWETDPLSADATEGYVIVRDGSYLDQVDGNISQYIDFNVQAGEFYNYGVYGKNSFGPGQLGHGLGFVNPNGTITGVVKTLSGNPVEGSIIRLTPTIGKSMKFNGVNDNICITYDSLLPTDMFTASAWVKIGSTYDSDGILDLGSDLNKNFWIKTTPSTSSKGVQVGIGDGTNDYELFHEFAADADGWHQVAVVYSAGTLLLYVDGSYVSSINGAIVNVASILTIGSNRDNTGYFDGKIDDVRIYNRPLTGTEIHLTKDISISKKASGLVAYWKFDEGVGSKVFDITDNDVHGFINGADYSDDNAGVANAGTTDVSGFYSIESINYSTHESFTATPSKIFYSNYALEFNKAYESYATLTNFDIPDTSTVEAIIHPFDTQSDQVILSNGSDNFILGINGGNLTLTLNGETQILGPLTSSYQHIALTMNGGLNEVVYFNNGTPITTLSFTDINGDWSANEWQLASKNIPAQSFFTGLIDEVSFYKAILPQSKIEVHASSFGSGGTNIGDGDLLTYFDLSEGLGDTISDTGPTMSGKGGLVNANFSIITLKQEESPHLFRPNARVVNINTSNTAVSGIDFTDESTVTVSGVIRFKNTFCFQDSAEIYVNGEPAFPPIYTNSSGEFVGDFEPGSSVILTPHYRDKTHFFSPGFFEVRRLNRPISSVLFQNTTTRTIRGQVSGGDSKLSVISPTDLVRVKVTATDLCYEKELQLEDANGKFEFKNLPPIPLTTAVTLHTDPTVYDYLQIQGGATSDMRTIIVDTVDFRYYADPKVFLQPFEETMCTNGSFTPYPTIDESTAKNGNKLYNKTIRMYEDYVGGRDWLKNFDLTVTNNLNDDEPVMFNIRDTSAYKYSFYAGQANIGGDFTKFIQVLGTSPRGEQDVVTQRAIVLGERARESSFVTATPTLPTAIIRDPYGDGSSSTWEKGVSKCTTIKEANISDFTDSQTQTLKLGNKFKSSTGIGFAVITELEVKAESSYTGTKTTSKVNEKETEICITAQRSISTSSGDAITGDQADLYLGNAVNLEFSANDVLWLNPNTCEVRNDSLTVSVDFKGFETEFIYSEWQILTTVIPNLELVGDTISANTWRRSLARNKELKSKAKYKKNLTFDGLASITETSESTNAASESIETTVHFSGEFSNEIGFTINDAFGFNTKFGWTWDKDKTDGTSTNNETVTSISYTLEDDDPNDSYSIDILDDPIFGTPVFRLKAGETMCPWVPGTLNREEIGLQVDRLTAVDVPATQAAIFRIQLSNLGQTGGDPLVYMIGLEQGTNPDGAIVELDGESLINPIIIQLQAKETKEFLISVKIGPDVNVFDYNNLGIYAASLCQFEHSLGLGYNIGAYANWIKNNPTMPVPIKSDNVIEGIYNIVDLNKFYKNIILNVEFQEPCSPINIGFPFQEWVQTPSLGDNLTISLNSYINNDPDLELLRVQYRRTGGDGAWINIADVAKAELVNPVSHNLVWDMSELADGPYEIRAISQCFSGLNAGISAIIKGRKETQPPFVFGTPQPADGVLSPGDEISIEYSKRIDCDKIFKADGIGTNINFNNLALQDMTEGGLVDFTKVCKDTKIVLIPNIANQFIENHTLRVTATDIKDLYGNPAVQNVWEFYVNRSKIYWVGNDINEVVLEGNSLELKREIRNQSGEVVNFEIYDVPNWMDVFPLTGTILPGASLPVTFSFPSDLVAKAYNQTINLSTQIGRPTTPSSGNEPLVVDLRVACPSPDWYINPASYSYSMNFVLELNIEGELSEDKLDKVGAFIDGNLSGYTTIKYNKEIKKYLAFLTAYSNISTGETVEFQIWDASECKLFANNIETFVFVADDLIGTPLVTQVIHTDNQLLRKIHIHPGWNWISFNLQFPNSSVGVALSSLTNPAGALIKDQTNFSAYSTIAADWFGGLTNMEYTTMYQFNGLTFDSISMVGFPVDPSTPLPLVSGWNWVSYLPQGGIPVTEALSSLTPLNGDIIKGQLSFAVYVAAVGWVGNLNYLDAPNGYLLKLNGVDTLIYPDPSNFRGNLQAGNRFINPLLDPTKTTIDKTPAVNMPFSFWQVDPTKFEHSMNAIAFVASNNGENLLREGDEVGAFVGDEVRGSSKVTYIPALDVYLVFMTIYANQEGELVTYKFFNSTNGEVHQLVETNGFIANNIVGTVDNPKPLHLAMASGTSYEEGLNGKMIVYPNPFASSVFVKYCAGSASEDQLVITDVLSRVVTTMDVQVKQGLNIVEWKPNSEIQTGTYFITLKNEEGSQMQKVLYIK